MTGELLALRCNLEDLASTILRGHFALMVVLAPPAELDAITLVVRLQPLVRALDVHVSVWPTTGRRPRDRPTHAINVYGVDNAGIVRDVAEELATVGANVCEASSRLYDETQLFVLSLDVHVPADGDVTGLRHRLASRLSPQALKVSPREIESAEL